MNELSYTLLADGGSDRQLIPLITWTIRQHTNRPISSTWADLSVAPVRPRGLANRIEAAVLYYPSDVLLIHRDAERESVKTRTQEINQALQGLNVPPVVAVVPVRMQEAWFLFHEQSIRAAVGNPNGTTPLNLPSLKTVEQIADPKALLFDLVQTASELQGRRLKRLILPKAAYRIGDLIDDFDALRALPAFCAYESQVRALFEE